MRHKVSDALRDGREYLLNNNVEPREARLLLAYSMGILSDDLVRYKECSDKEYSLFINLIKRRADGEPYAYLIGEKEFMKLNFKVNEYTLIPREDTEILVQKAIDIARQNCNDNKKIEILDMCTGSGCIAISLAKYIKYAYVDAVDVSEKALEIARENAEMNNVKVNFIQSDLFENIEKKYDIIVSNPPYIALDDISNLQNEIKHEPILALNGGYDGLDFYRKISKESKNYLKDNGVLLFEIGFNQGQDVSSILNYNDYKNIEITKDLSGNDRVVCASLS